MNKEASIELKIGRRDIEDSELSIVNDLEWIARINKWAIKVRIVFKKVRKKIELQSTEWYILLDEIYPCGEIIIYPDGKNGIKYTYPHQSYNTYKNGERWRDGNVCLDSQNKVINRMVNDYEPNSPEFRLKWYCERLKRWIILADEDKLLQKGDYFEMPVFPIKKNKLVLSEENKNTFLRWKYFYNSYGIVSFYKKNEFYAINEFKRQTGNRIYKVAWGDMFNNCNVVNGIWILIDELPLIKEWNVIRNWGELVALLNSKKIDVYNIISKNSCILRNGKNNFMLIGFPIPNKIGECETLIHWQAIEMPILTWNDREIILKGFMKKEKKYLLNDKINVLSLKNNLEWIKSENWNENNFYSRGMLSNKLIKYNIILIGCGSLGSNIAEYLARGGIRKLTLIDNEVLVSGNLVRHTLTIDSINNLKVEDLKKRLISFNPKIKVNIFANKFTNNNIEGILKEGNNLIIDCTANNNVLEILNLIKSYKNNVYINASFSKGAKILFLYRCTLESFKSYKFLNYINNYNEKYEHEDIELPREGIGCWHPVFPAKMYDIALLASIVVNYIDEFVNKTIIKEEFVTYETKYINGIFNGIEKVCYE